MPQVPRYSTSDVQTRQIAAPQAQGVTPDQFGATLGQAFTGISRETQQLVKDENEKAKRTALLSARSEGDRLEVELLYGTKDKPGALSQKGENAFSIDQSTLAEWDKRIGEVTNKITDKDVKESFGLLMSERRNEVQKQLQRHINTELNTYADEKNKAALETTTGNVALHYNDPERIEKEREFGVAVIRSNQVAKGLPPELVKAQLAKWDSTVHSTVIDRLMVDNAVQAKEYFDKNKDFILPEEAVKIEKQLHPLASKQIGMDTALRYGTMLGSKPLTEVLGEVRTELKSNPDALNLAETQLKQMEAERRDQIKQEGEAAAKPVYERIAKIQLLGRSAKLSDIPSEEWANLVKKAPEEAGKIQDAIRRERQAEEDRAERKREHAEILRNRETMNQVMNWAALNGDPDSLLNANLDKLYTTGAIGKEHYRSLSTKQTELRNNPDKGVAIRSETQTVEDIFGAAKLKKGSEEHSQAWEYIEGRKQMFVAENKRQPTRKELQDIARESVYKVDSAGTVFDKPLYKITFDDIPKKERAKIIDAFNRRGQPYTQADVVRAYGKAQMKGGI